jgi:hypothetical protein
MSRQFRLRATGVVLGALFVVGPLVMNGTAQAEVGSGNDLVFSGGGRNMLGLSCVAEPRSDSVTVESGSTVRVINDTGHDADLQLNGVSKGELADNASTDVLFRRGPVEVMLKPDCVLGGPSEPVLVTVTPAPTTANPTPTPTTNPTTASPVDSPSNTTTRPATRPTTRPTRPPHTAATPPRRPVTATTAATADGMPQRATTRARTRTTTAGGTGTATTAAPAVPEAPLPIDTEPVSSGPVLAAPEIDDESAGPSGAAAEPVAALEPMSETSPVGLLALAATICLAGVTAGAIRAIVAQRASRASIA